jgi:hypothetical protein
VVIDIWIVVFKTEQQDLRIGAVYLSLDEAKRECERLENANRYANVGAIPVGRQLDVRDLL